MIRKKNRQLIVQCISLLLFVMIGFLLPLHAAASQPLFADLEKRLIADGFDSGRVKTLFASQSVSFEKSGVSLYFMHNEAKLNYSQFTRIWNISSAKEYMKRHRESLDAAQKAYGVDKEVITAIILVETKLGKFTGKRSVVNTLATLSAMADETPRQVIWENLPDNSRRMTRQEFEKKADRKSAWAYRELKAFLTYTEKEGMDPTSIKGSYAGAMGISQFMPSNIAPYGKDGNADGKINLFEHPDAIYSIASYLKHYGWKPGISREKAYKVVYHYNHSKYYVNTILEVAEKLKG
jgi:membrane-bound lytic murein transglycosylase B